MLGETKWEFLLFLRSTMDQVYHLEVRPVPTTEALSFSGNLAGPPIMFFDLIELCLFLRTTHLGDAM